MARTVDVTAPRRTVDALLADLETLEDVVAVSVQRGGSLRPPGDVLTVTVTNTTLHPLMRLLDRHDVGRDAGTRITAAQPVGVVSLPHRDALGSGRNEAAWEEMQRVLAQDGDATANTLLLMAVAGVLAAIGVATGALHVVVGAMVIAPGFEPLVRVALDVVARGRARLQGLVDLGLGYAALVAGAMAATLALRAVDAEPLVGDGAYVDPDVLVRFWTTFDLPGLLVSVVAGVAGAIVVATFRSVLTAGVMIALALIPSAAIAGMALVAGEPDVAGRAALRWGLEVVVVLAASLLVLAWKRRTVHHRDTLM